jgi:hypothetical protein
MIPLLYQLSYIPAKLPSTKRATAIPTVKPVVCFFGQFALTASACTRTFYCCTLTRRYHAIRHQVTAPLTLRAISRRKQFGHFDNYKYGGPERIRTVNPLLAKQLLYQLELQARTSETGEGGGTRTHDQRIKSPVL